MFIDLFIDIVVLLFFILFHTFGNFVSHLFVAVIITRGTKIWYWSKKKKEKCQILQI
jgi:hypothetical protein